MAGLIDSKHHVVIASMPLVDSMHASMAAPAVLKASLSRANITSTAIDLNIEVLIKIKTHPEQANLKKFFNSQVAKDWVQYHLLYGNKIII